MKVGLFLDSMKSVRNKEDDGIWMMDLLASGLDMFGLKFDRIFQLEQQQHQQQLQ